MYHTINEFLNEWKAESGLTEKVFANINSESLLAQIPNYRRTVGQLAWHITGAMGEMMRTAGYPIDAAEDTMPMPLSASELLEAYKKASGNMAAKIEAEWNDADLNEKVNMYGEMWTREFILRVIVAHQVHHRAQLTVLMRLNNLKVPGVYGPSYEEWQQYGMEPLK